MFKPSFQACFDDFVATYSKYYLWPLCTHLVNSASDGKADEPMLKIHHGRYTCYAYEENESVKIDLGLSFDKEVFQSLIHFMMMRCQYCLDYRLRTSFGIMIQERFMKCFKFKVTCYEIIFHCLECFVIPRICM